MSNSKIRRRSKFVPVRDGSDPFGHCRATAVEIYALKTKRYGCQHVVVQVISDKCRFVSGTSRVLKGSFVYSSAGLLPAKRGAVQHELKTLK